MNILKTRKHTKMIFVIQQVTLFHFTLSIRQEPEIN